MHAFRLLPASTRPSNIDSGYWRIPPRRQIVAQGVIEGIQRQRAQHHLRFGFSQKSLKTHRTLPASLRKTNQGVYIVNSVKATKAEPFKFHFDDLWTTPSEPNDEGPLAVAKR